MSPTPEMAHGQSVSGLTPSTVVPAYNFRDASRKFQGTINVKICSHKSLPDMSADHKEPVSCFL